MMDGGRLTVSLLKLLLTPTCVSPLCRACQVGGMEGMLLMGPGRSPEEEGAEAGQGGRQGASTSGSPAAFLTSDSPLPPSAILAWDDHHR